MTVGRYHLVRKLGEGGMAEIYLGELQGPRRFRKRVVVKVLKEEHGDDAEQHAMFADEARVGSHLRHPHIPQVLELGEHEGRPYMIQEYVEGPSLTEVLRRERKEGQLDLRLACSVVADVAMALHHAHHLLDDQGRPMNVIHRDVSPSNVLVGVDGAARLIDFGVSRFEDRETHTRTDVLKGKLRYMAPETVLEGKVSPQSDLFALGVVLYMLTTGHPPWRTSEEVGERLQGRFPRPSERTPWIPAPLDALIMRTLATSAEDRPSSGEELALALREWLATAHEGFGAPQVAARIQQLFPKGVEEWLPSDEAPTFSHRSPRAKAPLWPWVAGLLAAGVAGVALAGAVVLGVSLGARSPEVVVPEPAGPDVEALLVVAEAAVAEDRMADAARGLRVLEAVEAVDASQLTRRQAVADEVAVWQGVAAVDARFPTDPDTAFAEALALLERHPEHPRVVALVERVRPPPPEAAPEVVRPAPPPRPRPAPAGPFKLKVEGSPEGSEVLVDGRFVGTVPVELVLDAGTHDVALRKEGYVQKREHLDDVRDGKTRTLRIDLSPLGP